MAECENHLELAALQHVIAMAKEPDENGNCLICRIGNDELVLRPIEPAPAKDKPRTWFRSISTISPPKWGRGTGTTRRSCTNCS